MEKNGEYMFIMIKSIDRLFNAEKALMQGIVIGDYNSRSKDRLSMMKKWPIVIKSILQND